MGKSFRSLSPILTQFSQFEGDKTKSIKNLSVPTELENWRRAKYNIAYIVLTFNTMSHLHI